MYYLVYVPLYLVSLLPLRILYLLSDLAYVVLYYIVGYRKQVVFNNLAIAFPEYSPEERKKIAKKFYKNFTDSFIETIKLFSTGNTFIEKHFTGDYAVMDALYEKGINKCQLLTGHFFNWEYSNLTLPLHLKYSLLTVYMPISNAIFERIFHKLRARTGAFLLPATSIRTAILPYRNTKYVLALVADQSPAEPKSGYWLNFFGKPAPFLKAPESGARRGDIPVVFCYFSKIKRGYYRIHFHLAEEHSALTKPGELTRKYAAYLEENIRRQPDMWLWSHRRWKWEWKPEYGPLIDNEKAGAV